MLACQKHLFSLPADLHYLNCAYHGPLLRRVEQAGIEGIRQKANPAAIQPEDFFRDSDTVRGLFARLVNAPDPIRIAIIPAVSYGMAVVARNTSVRPGQNLVLAHEQFPSNVYPWRALAREHGAEVRTVSAPEGAERRAEAWNARILEAIAGDTALVSVAHVHWADGTCFDLEAIGARAREVGAALVIDGTQSVGALPFDIERIRPDALVVTGYKWLLGPYGMGLAYFGPRYDGGVPLEENWIGRLGSEDFAGLTRYRVEYQPGALRYDVGERSNPILLPMLIAALEQVLAWGPEHIQAYCAHLTAGFTEQAREMGFAVQETGRASHLFGLRPPAGLGMDRIRAVLDAHRVAVSFRGDVLRVSPNVYNDEADIAALLEALHASASRAARVSA
ncbi:MAG: aminotransferase class V-fold PLP-dependent enzyme [Longimicrobiaceae bacterium]